MAGGHDVAAAGFHDSEYLLGLLANECRRALNQYMVGIDAAIEEEFTSEPGLKVRRRHVRRAGLQGLQTIDASVNHRGHERREAPAAVHHYLQAAIMRQPGQSPQMGNNESAKHCGAYQRASL